MKTRNQIFCVLGAISLFLIFFGSCSKKTAPNAVLHVDQNFNFPPGFPPDPGEAGKKTLEGVDSDHDGLRDDVQRWIYARYPNDERKRKALRQVAIVDQKVLNPNLTEKDLDAISYLEDKAFYCMYEVFHQKGNDGDVTDYVESKYVEAKVYNTVERTLQVFRSDGIADGKVFEGHHFAPGSACE